MGKKGIFCLHFAKKWNAGVFCQRPVSVVFPTPPFPATAITICLPPFFDRLCFQYSQAKKKKQRFGPPVFPNG